MASIVGPVSFASAPAYTFHPHTTSTAQRATVDSFRKARGEKRSEPTNLPTTNDDQANLNLLGEPGDVLFRLSFPVVGACHYPPELLGLPNLFLQ